MRRALAALIGLAMLGGGATACGSDGPDDALDTFLSGWKSGDLSKVGFVTAAGAPIKSDEVATEIGGLAGELPVTTLVVSRAGDTKENGDIATGTVKIDWTLPGGVPWSYQSLVRMTKRDSDGWRIIWEPSIVQKDLVGGDKLAVRRVAAERAAVLDAAGKPIVTPRPVVTIALDPARVGDDVPALATALTTALKKIKVTVDLKDLPARVAKAQENSRIDIVTLRREDYLKIRAEVRPLPGTTFPEESRALAPTRMFARALLGTVDLATAEDIDANPDTLAQGDTAGHGGIQERYDAKLRGTSGLSVVIQRSGDEKPAQVFSTKPVAGTPVKTTIDVRTQNAADAATATQKQPSALVAVRISDSAVLAVSNGPDGGSDNVALTGQVPPGSTFKMVSTLGLLQKKAVTADTAVDCPKTKEVAGKAFKNSHDMALGKVPFHTDFAKSCNTAFVNLSPKLGADGLKAASTALGLGAEWDLGMPAFSGKPSPADNPGELAQASFGQGQTAVSPIAMASATAAVARGKFVQPKLVLDPPPAKPAVDGSPIDAATADPLREMMREVVTSGTGTALKRAKGKPVYGKTGTAEFASGSPETHAWFIGWQDDVAFAVMVQKGGAGADTAVPIVSRFLSGLNG
ncbi:penicillin-binding transpeptidase domain-containing protein [Actinoplanes sp. NBRC 103695]|uniref:penicillin-binding transpeptidase domain-containing protein n=1 Tax=Actinoplanes sp. NBRC 103695 TaxID=3032202 RepID=UPI0024A2B38A|nr:penicillin-binding transpeptidase domain-containing protein [Actinoplanes sp. NBRC 103695]GLY99732.1 cell division protein FtsI [Actinoplanes sp. NBRC 103695]